MGVLKEFRDFAFKGSLIDMAVGIVMGGAVAAIIKSFLQNVFTPLIACVFSVPNMSALTLVIGTNLKGEVTEIHYGTFLQNSLDFIILAFVVFIALKIASKWMKMAEKEANLEEEKKPRPDIILLTEIRDYLKHKQ